MIRDLQPGDFAPWSALFGAYVDFYREEVPEEVARATFDRLVHRRDGMFSLVGEAESGEVVGMANALFHASTWTTGPACYLEDLFVAPAARGTGLARELIEAVASRAREAGAEKLYWHTQEFNGPARSLYDLLANRVSFVVYERKP